MTQTERSKTRVPSEARGNAFFRLEESQGKWFVRARFWPQETFLKVDTGSLRSQVPYDFVKRVGLQEKIRPCNRESVKYPFRKITIHGRIHLRLRLGTGEASALVPHDYLVVDQAMGILGLDFLYKYACKLTLDRRSPKVSLRSTP